MHLIILPGASREYNEKWLADSAEAYKELFESVTTFTYEWWKEGHKATKDETKVEAVKLENVVKTINGDYVILAKSAGTVVTVRAVAENLISPNKCIFLGSPWGKFASEQGDFAAWLEKFNIPTLFIQQTDDMFFKYEELEEVIDGNVVTNYRLIEIPGNNHAYDNYDEIKQWVKEFLLDE